MHYGGPMTSRILHVASSFTSTPLEASLGPALMQTGVAEELRFVQYDQVNEYMLGGAAASPDSVGTLLLIRVEDWLRQGLKSRENDTALNSWAREQLRQRGEEMLSHLASLASNGKPVWFVACPSIGWLARKYDLATLCATYTSWLLARMEGIPNITLVPWPASTLTGEITDPNTDRLGQIPYTRETFTGLGEILGTEISCRLWRAASGTTPISSGPSAGDLQAYLANLQVKVELTTAGPGERDTVDRLLRTVAGFSLKGEKRDISESEVDELIASETCMLVRVADRLSDFGLCGLVHFTPSETLHVKTMALSCRVLGKQVEHATVSALTEVASEYGASKICFEYHASGRNQPMRTFLQTIADRVSDGLYVLPLESAQQRIQAAAINPGAWSVSCQRPATHSAEK